VSPLPLTSPVQSSLWPLHIPVLVMRSRLVTAHRVAPSESRATRTKLPATREVTHSYCFPFDCAAPRGSVARLSCGPRGDTPLEVCLLRDGDLTDAQWVLLDFLVPEPPRRRDGRGRPWRGRRQVLNCILFTLRTGAPWPICPTGILPNRPAAAVSSNRFAPGLYAVSWRLGLKRCGG
jgi:Putative transposase of IS4/5 family (DUF4096)